MNKVIVSIAAIFSLMILQSCKSSDDSPDGVPPYEKGHYIQFFMSDLKDDGIIIEDAKVQLDADNSRRTIEFTSVGDKQPGNCFSVSLSFNNTYSASTPVGVTNRYFELAESIQDNHYPKTLYRSWLYNFPTAIVDTFQSVKIYTDQDYTADYPAGSDVSSLFSIYFEEPLRTIKNNYQTVLADDTYQDVEYMNHEYWKTFPQTISGNVLSTIDFSKKQFIGAKWFLIPNTKPDTAGDYVFRFVITTEQGKEIQKQTAPFKINI